MHKGVHDSLLSIATFTMFKVQPRLEHTRRDTGEREMWERRKPEGRRGNS